MKINWNGLSTFTKEKCQGGICKTPCKHLSREAAIRKEFLDPTLYNPTRSNIYHIEVWLADVELKFIYCIFSLMLINETNIKVARIRNN